MSWIKKEVNEYLDMIDIDSFVSNKDGLTFICSFKSGNKKVNFENYLLLRTMNEGDALRTLDEQQFDGKAWMFMADDSELIDWFNEQSFDIRKGTFKHFIIVGDEIAEILSESMPTITAL
ncbi:hypothetical protein [Acinetobacter boissieri]|uniref:Uncharacterized protein n=1 Tax=Acinetobacter boissieri TaxID=1219383 RepID=A0A1G6H381_9GAMM|nr:hypothetical protein [Acinetobacter boissieri]SDB88739.1 hypothetical protein SAMN05421733_103241 [Acinetobacter boissieri]